MFSYTTNTNKIYFAILLVIIYLGTGCTPKTSYQTIEKTAISSSFSVHDQVSLVSAISSKLLNSKLVQETVASKHPTLLVDIIKNKTSEHIDTESITDTLKSSIIASGNFRLINRSKLNLLAKEQELNSLGLTDSYKATKLGKLYGAQYVLYGNFSSIVNYVARSKNTYYKLTVFLQNIETGEEVWVGESSINKVTK